MSYTPSMSRAAPTSRVANTVNRPAGGTNTRSAVSTASRPGGFGSPTWNGPPPGTNRAGSVASSAAARPSAGNLASRPNGGPPSRGQLNDFIGGTGGGPGAATRPTGGNSVSDFLGIKPATGAVGGAAAAVGKAAEGIRQEVGRPTEGGRPDGRPADGMRPDAGTGNRLPDRVAGVRAGDGIAGDRLPGNRPPGDRLPGDRRSGELHSRLSENRNDRLGERHENVAEVGDKVRDHLSDHFDDAHLFDNFWEDHPNFHYQWHQNPIFWTWAGFNALGAFLPSSNWEEPIYYDYGYGGNVYTQGESIYINDTAYPLDQYEDQLTALATNPPQPEAGSVEEIEWLPLGVFAVTKARDPNAVPNMFLQLAVSREGIIAGTYENKLTGQVREVEGAVDKSSQRAAWTLRGKDTPIVETGLYNLTLNETTALVHFADGQVQEWLMIRIEPPHPAEQTAPKL
jgi:hypothetical protein